MARKLVVPILLILGLCAALMLPAGAEPSEQLAGADANEGPGGTDLSGRLLTAGQGFTCAIVDTGDVRCWGWNRFGQLGVSTNVGTHNPNPAPLAAVSLGRDVVEVSAGDAHVCAILDNGDVRCWGSNKFGQLGSTVNIGTTTATPAPQPPVNLGAKALSISAGAWHTCAVLENGDVRCWGNNASGQLGSATNLGLTTPNTAPLAAVPLLSGASRVAASKNHTCALLNDATVRCWGHNFYGLLGPSVPPFPITGVPGPAIPLGADALTVVMGDDFACALLVDGAVRCWGQNIYAQLGSTTNNGANHGNPDPQPAVALDGPSFALAAGGSFVCAAVVDADVQCWGSNFYDNSLGMSINPVPLPGLDLGGSVHGVTAGSHHACVLTESGHVRCWGGNYNGELGSPIGAQISTPPVAVALPLIINVGFPEPTSTPTPVPPTPTPTPHVPSGTSGSFVTANLEELEAGPGEIRVHGWAYDPDLPSKDLVVHVYAFFDGVGDPVALGTPVVRAADFRPDINRAFGIKGDHGFNRSLKIRNGNHRVCVYSLSVDGAGNLDDLNELIGCRSVTVTDEAPPRGAFDVATQTGTSMKVSGWAYDLDRENDSLDIQVFLDGAFFKTIKADTSRTDVNKIVQISGDHGFNSTFEVPAGGHQVCLYVIGVDPTGAADGENVLLNVIDKPDCRTTDG